MVDSIQKVCRLHWGWHMLLSLLYSLGMYIYNASGVTSLTPLRFMAIAAVYTALYMVARQLTFLSMQRRWTGWQFGIGLLLAYIGCYLIVASLFLVLPRTTLAPIYKEHLSFSWITLAVGVFLFFLRYTIYGVLAAYLEAKLCSRLRRENQKKELLLRHLQRVNKDLKRNELATLVKAEVPHFLYNLMQQVYLDAESGRAKVLPSWTGLLEYSLDTLAKQEKRFMIALEREIQVVRLLLDYYQQIYNVQVLFTIEGTLSGYKIPRFTLVSLMQNIFKHAAVTALPALLLRTSPSGLYIRIRNQKRGLPRWQTGHDGAGMMQTRRLLEAVYGGALCWEQDEGEEFSLIITISYQPQKK